jgi:hypothetical protein
MSGLQDLSDADLQALYQKQQAAPSGLQAMSDDDLKALYEHQNRSIGEKALDVASDAGQRMWTGLKETAKSFPVIGALVPQSEDMTKYEKDHPTVTAINRVGGNAAASIPLTLAGASAGLPLGVSSAVAGGGVNAADTAARGGSPKDVAISGGIGAAAGALPFGQVGKATADAVAGPLSRGVFWGAGTVGGHMAGIPWHTAAEVGGLPALLMGETELKPAISSVLQNNLSPLAKVLASKAAQSQVSPGSTVGELVKALTKNNIR